MYGPVRTVVWEGRSRKAPPYPDFLIETELTIISFGEAHWRSAMDAYQRYGKGHHGAGLNFGDCLTYAAAKLARQPLLCAGADFAKTDLPLA